MEITKGDTVVVAQRTLWPLASSTADVIGFVRSVNGNKVSLNVGGRIVEALKGDLEKYYGHEQT